MLITLPSVSVFRRLRLAVCRGGGWCADLFRLQFQKILVVSLPSRSDRRDGMVLNAALSNIQIEFIDGVLGQDVVDKAISTSPDHDRLKDPTIGSWRAHMNAIRE